MLLVVLCLFSSISVSAADDNTTDCDIVSQNDVSQEIHQVSENINDTDDMVSISDDSTVVGGEKVSSITPLYDYTKQLLEPYGYLSVHRFSKGDSQIYYTEPLVIGKESTFILDCPKEIKGGTITFQWNSGKTEASFGEDHTVSVTIKQPKKSNQLTIDWDHSYSSSVSGSNDDISVPIYSSATETAVELTVDGKSEVTTYKEKSVTLNATVTANGNVISAGYVAYYVNGELYDTVAAGQSITFKSSNAGSYLITARYTGYNSPTYLSSNSNSVTVIVKMYTVTLTTNRTDVSNLRVGQTVKLTATVKDENNNTITNGYVKYSYGATEVAVVNAGESYDFVLTYPTVLSMEASYYVDSLNEINWFRSNSIIMTIKAADTNTEVILSKDVITKGETIRVSAKVLLNDGVTSPPNGRISYYYNNGIWIGNSTLTGYVSFTPATSGSYNIYATYIQTAYSTPRYSSSTSQNKTLTVNNEISSTDIEVILSGFSVEKDKSILLSASVSSGGVLLGSGDGSVSYYWNGSNLIDTVSVGSSVGFTPSIAGVYNIHAVYNGNAKYNSSTSGEKVLTVLSSTDIEVDLSVLSVEEGESILLSVSVSSGGVLLGSGDGSVSYYWNGSNLIGTVSVGSSVGFTPSVAGVYNIYAVYNGNAKYNSSTSGEKVLTVLSSTDIEVILSGLSVDVGESILLSVSVSSGGVLLGSGDGSVSYYWNGSNLIGTGDLGSSVSFTPSIAGVYNIYAVYNGNEKYNSSTSDIKTLTVNKGISLTNITLYAQSSANLGSSVTLSAEVTSGGSRIYDGTISYYWNGTNLIDTVPIGSYATFTPTDIGVYTIHAVYNGNSIYNQSTSTKRNLTVTKLLASTAVSVYLSDTSIAEGNTIKLSAEVTSDGSPIYDGIVSYYWGDNNFIGNSTVNGLVQFTPQNSGSFSIYAVYNANSDYAQSQSQPKTLTVVGDDYTHMIFDFDYDYDWNELTVSVKLKDDAGGSVTLYIDGKEQYQESVSDGEAWFYIGDYADFGKHIISAVFSGDGKYQETTNSTTYYLTGEKTFTLRFDEISYVDGEMYIKLASSTPVSGAYVIFTIDNVDYDKIQMSGLTSEFRLQVDGGLHNISAFHSGNMEYHYANISTTYYVMGSEDASMEFNIEYTDNKLCIALKMPEDAKGDIKFVVDNKEYSPDSYINGLALLNVSATFGKHNISANFSGDGKYHNSTNSTTFTVLINPDMIVTVANATYMATAYIYVELPGDAKGNVSTIINGKTYSQTVNGNKTTISLPDLDINEYIINVTYTGDEKYNRTIQETKLSVYIINPEMTVNVTNASYGKVARIDIKLPSDATGKVFIEYNDVNLNKTLESGTANFTIDNLRVNIYDVKVTYAGEGKYNTTSKDVKLNISKSDDYEITIDADNKIAGQNIVIKVILPDKLENKTNIKVFLNNSEITLTDFKYIIEKADVGQYNVTVCYLGDDSFKEKNFTYLFEIEIISNYLMTVEINESIAGNDTIIDVGLPDNAEGNVTVTLNTKNYESEVKNGLARITIPGLTAGSHPITVEYSGDGHYTGKINDSIVIETIKGNVTLIVTNIKNITYGDHYSFYINVYPNMAKGKYNITIGNKTEANRPIESGIREVISDHSPEVGEYNITITYFDDDNFNDLTVKYKFYVLLINPIMSINITDASYGHNATIKVSLPENTTGTVRIDIADKILNKTLNKGTAEFNISGINANVYDVKITYSGDDKYNTTSADAKLNISKSDDYSWNVKANYTNITVFLPANATGNVTVIVDGSEYDVIEFENTTFSFDLNVNPGKHNVTLIYSGDDNYHGFNSEIDVYNIDGSFKQLQLLIDKTPEGNVLVLDRDYGYLADVDDNSMILSKSIIINGNGYSLDALNNVDIFKITSSDIVLNNITFKNAGDEAILFSSQIQNISLVNSRFIQTTALAIENANNLLISNCEFSNGLNVYDNVEIINSTINGDINFSGSESILKDSKFSKTVKITGIISLINNTQTEVNEYSIYNEGTLTLSQNTFINPIINRGTIDKAYATVLDNMTVRNNTNPATIYAVLVDDNSNIIIDNNFKLTINNLQLSPVYLDKYYANYSGQEMGVFEVNATSAGIDNLIVKTAVLEYLLGEKINITVDVGNVTYGEDIWVNVYVPEDAEGNITITVNNKLYLAKINNGVATTKIDQLSAGNWTLEAFHPKDLKYEEKSNSTTFNIAVLQSKPVISVENNTYDETTVITVTLDKTANGNVSILNNYNGTLINGSVSIKIPNLSVDNYTVSIYYNGDENHTENTTEYKFSYNPKSNYEMDVVVENNTYENSAYIHVYLPDNAEGWVSTIINDKNYSSKVTGHYTVIELDDLRVNIYNLTISYTGDKNYTSKNISKKAEIYKSDNYTIDINVTNPIAGQNALINITLQDKLENKTDIKVFLNNSEITLTDFKYIIENADVGKYNVTVQYLGDDSFKEKIFTYLFEIEIISTYPMNIEINESIAFNDTIVTVYLPDNTKGNVTVTLANGSSYNAYVEKGIATIIIPDLTAGNHTVTVEYTGDNHYTNKIINHIIETIKANATLSLHVRDFTYGDNIVIDFTILSPKSKGKFSLKVGETTETGELRYGRTLVIRGLDLVVGEYEAVLSYWDDDNYNYAVISDKFNILLINPEMEVNIVNSSYGNNATVKVTLPENATGTVRIDIADKILNKTLDKGIAIFNISGINADVYNIKITYSGDDKYNTTSDDAKLNISKSYVYKYNITLNDNNNFTVTLPVNATGNLSVIIDGNEELIPINSLTITVPLNLAPGNHTVNVAYTGDNNYGGFSEKFSADNIEGSFKQLQLLINENNVLNLTRDYAYLYGIDKGGINITKEITINGNGHILNALGKVNIFNIMYPNVILNNITYVNAKNEVVRAYNGLIINSSKFINTTGTAIGNAGNITIANSEFINNTYILEILDNVEIINTTLNDEIKWNGENGILKDSILSNKLNINGKVHLINNTQTESFIYNEGILTLTHNTFTNPIINKGTIDKAYATVLDNRTVRNNTNPATIYAVLVDDNSNIIIDDNFKLTINNLQLSPVYLDKYYANYSGQEMGVFEVNATSEGIDNLIVKTAVLEYLLGEKINITVNVSNVVYGEDIWVNVYVPWDAEGNITITVNNKVYLSEINNGVATTKIDQLPAGNWTLEAFHPKGLKYEAKSNSTTFNIAVLQSKPLISVENNTYNETTVITVTLDKTANGNISILDNYNGTLINGSVTIKIPDLSVNNYTVSIYYTGDENHTENTTEYKFSYNPKSDYELNIAVVNVTVDKNASVIVSLPKDTTGQVTVTVGDKIFNTSVIDGKANVTVYGLVVNLYSIKINYAGDKNYTPKEVDAQLNISKIKEYNLNINKTEFTGDKTVITIDLPYDANKTVTITINSINYTAGASNGKANVETLILPGNYDISVSYSDDIYDYRKVNKTIGIAKLTNYTFTVSADAIYVDDDAVINITLDDGASGRVFARYNGTDYEMNNNQIIISDLAEGIYHIPVTYMGNEKYNLTTKIADITVSKIGNYQFTFNNETIEVGDNATINIILPDDATGIIYAILNNQNYSNTVNNGRAKLTFENLSEGNYNIELIYTGNNKYVSKTQIANIFVSKYDSYTFNVTVNPIHVGDNAIIYITLPDDATGNVSSEINNQRYTSNITGGKANLTIPDLPYGNHNLIINYTGDYKYTSNTRSTNIVVLKVTDYTFTVTGDSILVDDEAEITVTLPDDARGNVSAKINNNTYIANVENNTTVLTIPKLPYGNHTIIITYSGDDKYANNNGEASVNVSKVIEYTFNVECEPIKVGENATINITLPDDIKANAFIKWNDTVYTAINNKIIISGLSNDTYYLTVIYPGDSKYNLTSKEVTVEVYKLTEYLFNIDSQRIYVGQDAKLNITLPDDATGRVYATYNNMDYDMDVNGQITIPNLANDTYTITVTYAGDGKYNSTLKNTVLEVFKVDDYVLGVNSTYYTGNNSTVILINLPDDADKNATITFNGQNYTDYVLPVIPGEYDITVSYSDDKYGFKQIASKIIVLKLTDYLFNLNHALIHVGEDAIINVTLPGDAYGRVYATYNNMNYEMNSNNQIVIQGLANGTYDVFVTYEGNYEYNLTVKNITLKVFKVDDYVLSVDSTKYDGNKTTIAVNLPYDADKNATITFNGQNYTDYVLPVIPGEYEIIISYGDDKYNFKQITATVNVAKLTNYTFNLTSNTIKVSEDAIINITLPADVSGSVYTIRNGVNYSSNITGGNAEITIPDLKYGLHEIIIIYSGDERYNLTSKVAEVNVLKISDYTFDLTSKPVRVGEDAVITVTLPEDITSQTYATFNSTNYTAFIKTLNGVKSIKLVDNKEWIITIANMTYGNHTIPVYYSGDDKYTPESKTVTVNVDKVTDYPFNLTSAIIKVGENAKINVILPDDSNGYVYAIVNGKNCSSIITNAIATITLPDLTYGNHTVNVTYTGDDKYNSTTKSVYVNVSKVEDYKLDIEITSSNIAVLLPEDVTENVTVIIDSNSYDVSVNNGYATISIRNLTEGNHNLAVIYNGDDKYLLKSVETEFNNTKEDVLVFVYVEDIIVDDDAYVDIILNSTDATGTVVITINNMTSTHDLVGNTITVIQKDLPAGVANVTVTYLENDNYHSAKNQTTFNVIKYTSPMTVNVSDIVYGQNLTVNVELPLNADGTVSVVINNKTYNETSQNGISVIKIPNLDSGVHNVTVTYLGNSKYSSNSTDTKITVFRNDIIGDSYIEIKNKTNGEVSITIVLPDNLTGNITISINNNTYTVKEINTTMIVENIPYLPPGDYNITVNYTGDHNHDSFENTTKITIPKISNYLFNTTDLTIKVGENALITIQLPADAKGNIYSIIDGLNHSSIINMGNAQLTIEGLVNGTYYFTVIYEGDNNYTYKSKIVNVGVFKVDNYQLNMTTDNTTVIISIPDDLKYGVNVSVDGKNQSIIVENGKISLNLSDLNPGNHTVNVTYGGDDKYLPNTNSTIVNVPKINDYLFNVSDDAIKVGENATIIIELPFDAKGILYIVKDNNNYSSDILNGHAVIKIPDLAYGNYSFDLTYSGDNNYTAKSKQVTVNVTKVDDYIINITKTGCITLPDDIKNNITLVIDNNSENITLTGAKLQLNLSQLTPGNHTVSVTYLGDDKYTVKSNSIIITIAKITDYIFNVSDDTIKVGENATITVQLPADAKGNVSTKINNKTYISNITNGNVTFTIENLKNGTYILNITYSGDNNYTSGVRTSNIGVFKVDRYQLNITVNITDVTVTLPLDITGNVVVSVDGKNQSIIVENGEISLNLSGLNPGNHTVNVTYGGDDKYLSNTNSTIVNVPKINDYIFNVYCENINVGENATVSIELPFDAKGTVYTIKDNINYSSIISGGQAIIKIPDLANNTYSFDIIYTGDNNYTSCVKTANVGVFKVENYTLNITCNNSTVTVTLPEDAENNITVSIDGKNQTIQLNNSKTDLNISDLSPGNHTISITYTGDDKYSPLTNSTTINIPKINNYTFKANDTEINVGEDAIILINLPYDAKGNVSTVIGNITYSSNISDGVAALIIPGLVNNTYSVEILYSGDNNYTSNITKSTVSVYKVDEYLFEINIDEYNITVTLANDTSGNITIEIDGTNHTIQIANGSAGISIANLTESDHNISVYYGGDNKYNPKQDSKSFNNKKDDVTIEIRTNDITVGEYAYIVIRLTPENATGEMIIKTNNATDVINYTEPIRMRVDNVVAGLANVTVIFKGNSKYHSATNQTTFNVFKYKSPISAEVLNITYGENATVKVNLPSDSSGQVSVNILNKTYNSTVDGGIAIVNISDLNGGTHNVIVEYLGNNKYSYNMTTISLTVYKKEVKNASTVKIENKTQGEILINITLPADITGNITVIIDNKNYTTLDVNDNISNIIISNLTPGNHSISVIYNGGDDYESFRNDTTINISKIDEYIFNINNCLIKAGENATINIELPLDAESYVYTLRNGVNYSSAILNGHAKIIIPDLKVGEYEIEITYTGDNNYTSKTKTAYVNVSRIDYYSLNITINSTKVNIILPVDINGNVTVAVDGKNQSVIIVNGSGETDLSDLTPGNHTINITFEGNSKYQPASNSTVITIPKISDYIFTVNDTVINVGEDAMINIELPHDAKGSVYTIRNGINYSSFINSGKSVIIIPNLDNETYNIDITYTGDNNYTSKIKIATVYVFKIEKYTLNILINGTKINIMLPGDISGNVTLVVDGKNQSVIIVNGSGETDLSDLTPGNHTINITFEGNGKYQPASNSTVITIPKISEYVFTVSNDNICVGENAVITVQLPGDSKGDVYTLRDGVNYSSAVLSGNAKIIIPDLNVGEYEIEITYTGDNNYTSKTKTAHVNVSKIDYYHLNITINGTNVNITLPDDITGNVTVVVDGKNQSVNVVNGSGEIDLSDLTPGNHTVNITFEGDGKYQPITNSTLITIPKISDYLFALSDAVIKVGENAVINIQLPFDAKGYIYTLRNNVNYSSAILNSNAKIIISDLNVGEYEIEITYTGDNNYTSKTKTAQINVSKFDVPKININFDSNIITINLPADINADIIVSIDGQNRTVKVTDGKANINVSDLAPGNHTITVIYPGDEKYQKTANSTLITIPKISDYQFTISANSIGVGNNAIINITLPNDANGRVTATVNGITYTGIVNNGQARITIPNLAQGNYNIPITYTGSDKYADISKIAVLSVLKSDSYEFNVNAGNDVLTVTLPGDAHGSVTVTINGKTFQENINNGKAIFDLSDFDYGVYSSVITYSGDSKYLSKTLNMNIDIESENPLIITADDVVKYYHGSERLNVKLRYSDGTIFEGEKVIISINGNLYNRVTDENGSASIALNLNSGNYTAAVRVNRTVYDVSVIIKGTVSGENVTKVYRNATHYYAYFLDSNGNPLASGSEVTFNINGVFYKRLVEGSEGRAKLNLNLEQGTYILTAINPVNGEMFSNTVTVLPRLVENNDLTKYYRNSTQYSLRVIGDDGNPESNAKVTFNINGVFYTRTSNSNGYVNFNINLEPGEYILTAEYKNCRVSNKVVVLPILTGDDLVMKYRDGSRFTVKLLDGQGKAHANQVIKFNFKGMYYEKVTDENGIATLGIIALPGEYIITSIYENAQISNTIKVTR